MDETTATAYKRPRWQGIRHHLHGVQQLWRDGVRRHLRLRHHLVRLLRVQRHAVRGDQHVALIRLLRVQRHAVRGDLLRIQHNAVRGEQHDDLVRLLRIQRDEQQRVGVHGQQRVDDVLRGDLLRLWPDVLRGEHLLLRPDAVRGDQHPRAAGLHSDETNRTVLNPSRRNPQASVREMK